MAENITIGDLRSQFTDGARAYLFVLDFDFPTTLGFTAETAKFLVRATSIPPRTIDPIIVPYAGMEYKVGSVNTYQDWTVTFMVDILMGVKKTFDAWAKLVHDPQTNLAGLPGLYKKEIKVHQLNGQLIPIYTNTLKGCWPTSVGEIALSQETREIETFDVTFAVDYITDEGGILGT